MRKSAFGGVVVIVWLSASGCHRAVDTEANRSDESQAIFRPLPTGDDDDSRLDRMIRDHIEAAMSFSPTRASALGAHEQDARLDDSHLDAWQRESQRLQNLKQDVLQLLGADDADAAHTTPKLDAAHLLDANLLLHDVQVRLYDITERRPLERDPIWYVDVATASIDTLLNDTLPLTERVRDLTARLRRFRVFFEESRKNLKSSVTDLQVHRASDLATSLRGFIADTLPHVVQPVADTILLEEFRLAAADATRVLDDEIAWLQQNLLPRAKGEPALGHDKFAERVELDLATAMTPEEVAELAQNELARLKKQYEAHVRAVALTISPGIKLDPATLPSAAAVNKWLEDDRCQPEELENTIHDTADRVLAFGVQHKWIDAHTQFKVAQMLPERWGLLSVEWALPLEHPHELMVRYEPLEPRWSDRRKLDHLKELDRPAMALTLLHQIIGRYPFAEAARAQSPLRRTLNENVVTAGVASYFTARALGEGFGHGDARLELYADRVALLRVVRLVAAVRFHALGVKFDEIVRLFTDEAMLDDYAARRETERMVLQPSLAYADALGRLLLERLRTEIGPSMETRLLKLGPLPYAFLRDQLRAHP